METEESEFMNPQGKKTNQDNKRSKGKAKLETYMKKEAKCQFCRKKGQIKQDFVKFQQQLVKKGTSTSHLYYDAKIIDFNF